jgi:hypothetical protein
MTRLFTLSLIACSALSLSACSNWYWPDTYFYPKGYTEHDVTPVATPHGYNRSGAAEQRMKIEDAQNADAWRNALATVIGPVTSALDANRPVAITTAGGFSPLNASAANYLRDLLVKMGYLVALPSESNQAIAIAATPATDGGGMTDLRATVMRGDRSAISNAGTFAIPHQLVETSRMPGMTTYPAVGHRGKKLNETYN